MANEIVTIICDFKNTAHTTGFKSYCCGCNREVWISESVINAVKNEYDNDLVILCLICANIEMRKDKFKLMKPTAEQLNEITIAKNNQFN